MKMTGLIHNLKQANWDLWPSANEILGHALAGGARALGLENIGRLKAGFQADIVLLDLQGTALNPANHLQRQLVYCEDGRSVKHVFVAGRQVVKNGELTLIDEDSLKQEASSIRKQQLLKAPRSEANSLEPYYRQMLAKAEEKICSNLF